jgi:hypothetical protein
MSQSTFVSRRESIDRWTAALKRAEEKGVKIYRIELNGAYVATSGSRQLVAYRTDGIECECEAARHGDPVCIHRAKYWEAMGMLAAEVEPASATMPCLACRGEGQIWSEGSWSPDRCFVCSGTGHVDLVIDHIGPDNVVPFVRNEHPRPAA